MEPVALSGLQSEAVLLSAGVEPSLQQMSPLSRVG